MYYSLNIFLPFLFTSWLPEGYTFPGSQHLAAITCKPLILRLIFWRGKIVPFWSHLPPSSKRFHSRSDPGASQTFPHFPTSF